MTVRPLIFVVMACALAACASKTTIHSIPEGAKVYIDDEYHGVAPAEYSDGAIIGTRHNVRLELEGYDTRNVSFARDEEANVPALIGAVLFLVPGLWALDYRAEHRFELNSLAGSVDHAQTYGEAAMAIDLGDSKREVLDALMPTQIAVTPTAGREPDRFIDDAGAEISIHYFLARMPTDKTVEAEDFTPYVFKNGKLVAIGWTALRKTVDIDLPTSGSGRSD